MEPVSWMMLASAAISAGGMYVKGQNEAANLEQQAATQDYNAKMGFNQAQSQRAAGAAHEEQVRAMAQRQLGAGFAAGAQSGTRGGTTEMAIHDMAVQGELDAENAAYNADERARATYIGAQQSEYSAKVSRAQIGPAKFGAGVGAAGAIAGGASRMYAQGPTIE